MIHKIIAIILLGIICFNYI